MAEALIVIGALAGILAGLCWLLDKAGRDLGEYDRGQNDEA
jgi:hypothetical protein